MTIVMVSICSGRNQTLKRITLILLAALLFALPAAASAPVIGQSQALLQATEEGWPGACRDVTLGSYVADTMRLAAGTDFAFLPTDLLGLNLPAGAVDENALAQSLPRDETVFTVTLTAAQITELLEVAAAPLALDETESLDRDVSIWGGFLQISGLYVIYDVPAPVGERVYEINFPESFQSDFTDPSLTYTAAVPQSMLDGTYGFPSLTPEEEVGTLRELTGARIAAEGITREPDTNRILLYGARENEIIDTFPPMLIVFVILLFSFFGGHKWRRSVNFER